MTEKTTILNINGIRVKGRLFSNISSLSRLIVDNFVANRLFQYICD